MYFLPVRAFYSWRSTRQTFAGRTISMGDDHVPGRGSRSWQRMMIFVDDHNVVRQACSCWNIIILAGNKEPPFPDHLRATSGPFLAGFQN